MIASRRLKLATCQSTWSHLRAIFSRAVQVRAIERVPDPVWPPAIDDAEPKSLYDDAQLGAVYRALHRSTDLQVAFVVAVNCGPRAQDLFGLRWENFALSIERPRLEYVARKTGKRQCIPLAACTVAQLRRWQRAAGVIVTAGEACGLIWPHWQAERARKRATLARFKRVLATLGIRHAKPWQVARLTCNERLERHRPGAGQFVLGHSNTLNSRSYREPSGLIWEAVTTLPQPPEFIV